MKDRRFQGFRFWLAAPVLLVFVMVAIVGPAVVPHDPLELLVGPPLSPPSAEFWLGTDGFGRDLLSRLAVGARTSAVVAVAVSLGALSVGTPIGLILGYRGGALDLVSGRLIDVLFAFPSLLLALALATIMGSGVTTVIVALSIAYLPGTIRYVRGAVVAVRNRDFVKAAWLAGSSDRGIMVRHILPNIASQLLVYASAIIAFSILAEAALSFLGFGTQPPNSSWGLMLSENGSYLQTAPHLAIYPGLAIFLVVLALNILGDHFRDRFDPTLRLGR